MLPKILSTELKSELLQLDRIEKAVKEALFPSKPSHNDIHPLNMFIDGEKISLIDWGDAGMGDPYYDLSRASLIFAFHSEQVTLFISTYIKDVTDVERNRFFF